MRTPKPYGKPSLFCFSVLQANTYEQPLMTVQSNEKAGIFACDEFALLSSDMLTINGVKRIHFEPAFVGRSKDNTAANTKLFMNVWDSIKKDGRYADLDWTIKVDPDAVLLPERLRSHLLKFNGQRAYIVNCNKPMMTPMMFGALECISQQAMAAYYAGEVKCQTQLDWKPWGEDYFLGKCLDMLGVQATNDFTIYTDGVCKGVDCTNTVAAAFHPFKGAEKWMACYKTATR